MLRRLKVQTSGESHGRGMLVTVVGVPAGVLFEADFIDSWLARRQAGFGRSARQQIEHDRVEVLAGLYRGRTSGAPITLAVWNRDQSLPERPPVHRPRPGHADLAGGLKLHALDMRPVLERASARETAARVAAGALAASLLRRLGVDLLGHVVRLGPVAVGSSHVGLAWPALLRRRDRSRFAVLVPSAEARLERAVVAARKAGDTLGGVVEVIARGVPPGLGSLDGFDSRLDARLGAALLSIPAMKAVEIGEGIAAAGQRGSRVHDALGAPTSAGPARRSNRAGGVEGGMSNGEPVVVRCFMKPLATLTRPLPSWDFQKGVPAVAFVERSDVTAVPAAAVVAEAMVALVLLDALLEKTGGDSLREVEQGVQGHRRAVAALFGRPTRARARRPGAD